VVLKLRREYDGHCACFAGLNVVLKLRREPEEKAKREQEEKIAAAAIDKEVGCLIFCKKSFVPRGTQHLVPLGT
jgi:hypothetical protein